MAAAAFDAATQRRGYSLNSAGQYIGLCAGDNERNGISKVKFMKARDAELKRRMRVLLAALALTNTDFLVSRGCRSAKFEGCIISGRAVTY
jgi:hypothetical protein